MVRTGAKKKRQRLAGPTGVKRKPGSRVRKKGLEKYVDLAIAAGAREARIIPARYVVTGEWVRLKCRFGCAEYNKRLCCPPHSPTPETTRRMVAQYRRALVYTYEGCDDAKTSRRMQGLPAELERTAFLDGHHKAFAMAAEQCCLCRVCTTSKGCKFPDLARPPVEACGIDVYTTCRNAGIELHVLTCLDDTPKHVSLLLLE